MDVQCIIGVKYYTITRIEKLTRVSIRHNDSFLGPLIPVLHLIPPGRKTNKSSSKYYLPFMFFPGTVKFWRNSHKTVWQRKNKSRNSAIIQ